MAHLSCGIPPLARCPNQPCCGGHVIITHDLNAKTKTLMQMFRYGVDVHPEACAELAEALADDILRDVEILIEDLEAIKQWALRQKAKLNPTE